MTSWHGSQAGSGEWSPDGKSVSAINLFFPEYQSWEIEFAGACGGAAGIP
jgi:hypothetical protein